MIRIKRLLTTALPVAAAAVLMTTVPASASTSWSSCAGSLCDYGYVDGVYASIKDYSYDGHGAGLSIRLRNGAAVRVVTRDDHGFAENWFDSPVAQARICNWDGGDLYDCGGWRHF
ncbi:hypothetical protein [Streptomyces sp. cg36]|uniref:hypothetical protein n=1 Tax=Streptomyces sp. cg36 TaxID=3238798 RepID=UPI0034E212D4